ncbi:hypothetical protein DN752_17690 [Echinicola strongylocentroti]|uniref:Uncharacterized protein n=1 Tax=Echinicola strongylocentroti TaxID=1795355 RepID=A0A2Z4ILQ6_9BACT|nr:hypothetical protein [Echinicola strongylocentroti]AWW31814.1 hypothetical protein DN752_17690 [Echinicola strongylocentroti]
MTEFKEMAIDGRKLCMKILKSDDSGLSEEDKSNLDKAGGLILQAQRLLVGIAQKTLQNDPESLRQFNSELEQLINQK